MTGPSFSRPAETSGAQAAPAAGTADRLAKQVSGLRLACLAATIMIVAQDGLGYGVAQAVSVPSTDKGSGIFTAIGRALANGPIAITVHAALGLLLIITAISVIIRAILARRFAVLAISVIGIAAIVAATVAGARFVGTGNDASSTLMAVTSLVALACYVVCLIALRKRRSAVR